MYWIFYKSTISVNIIVSLIVTALTGAAYSYLTSFCVSFATVGLFAAFLFKEIMRPNDYYFFFNRGYSKIKLAIFCFIVNVLPATMFLIFAYYVAST